MIIRNSTGPGEVVTTKIQLFSRFTIDLVTMYRPPNEYTLENLEDLLTEHSSIHPILCVGDLNLPDIDWTRQDQGQIKAESKRKRLHENALNIFNSNNLQQLIKEPTHTKGNTLDLVLADKVLFDDLNIKCEVLPQISDHNMILITVEMQSTTARYS